MSNELYITGKLVEIDEGQTVALTKQISSIGEMQSRKANLSNNFKVKYSQGNEPSIAFSGRAGIVSKYPYRFLPARLVQNGFEIIRNGNAVIKDAGPNSANLAIYWGNNDFFDRLNFDLSELDLSELDHPHNRAGARNLANADADIIYPFIEYGNESVYQYFFDGLNRQCIVVDVSKAYPAIRVKKIWDAIFEKIGFSYSGSPETNEIFFRQFMQLTTKRNNIDDKTPYLVSSMSLLSGTGTQGHYEHDQIVFGNDVYFPRNDLRRFRNNTGFKGKFKFRVVFKGDWIKADTDFQLRVYAIKAPGGSNPHNITLTTVTVSESFYNQKEFEFEVDLDTVHSADDYSKNAEFYIYFRGGTGSTLTFRPGSTFQLVDFELPDINIGDTFEVKRNMPDMTAYDFIKNIAYQYGFIFETNNRHVNVITYDDIIQSKGEKKVFDYEIVPDSEIKRFNPGNYGQINSVSYKEGATPTALSSTFTLDNKTLDKSKDVVSLDFYLPDFIVNQTIGQILTVPLFDIINQSKIDVKKPPMFLMAIEEVDLADLDEDEIVPAFSNGNLTITPTSGISVALKYPRAILDDAASRRRGSVIPVRGVSPDGIIQSNYAAFIDVLERFVSYEISANINERQFYELELYTAYYVPLFRSYFLIEKISNFVPGKPTKISLIKL